MGGTGPNTVAAFGSVGIREFGERRGGKVLLLRRRQPVQGGYLLLLGHPKAGLQIDNPKVQHQILNPQAAGQGGGAWLQTHRQGAAGGDGG